MAAEKPKKSSRRVDYIRKKHEVRKKIEKTTTEIQETRAGVESNRLKLSELLKSYNDSVNPKKKIEYDTLKEIVDKLD